MLSFRVASGHPFSKAKAGRECLHNQSPRIVWGWEIDMNSNRLLPLIGMLATLNLSACAIERGAEKPANTPSPAPAFEDTVPSFGEAPPAPPADDTEPVDLDGDDDGFNADVDCDDADPGINPGASDDTCNGVDENCDGADLNVSLRMLGNECGSVDADSDNYMDFGFDEDGVPYVVDCDDANPLVNPGMTEVTYDGLDQDCDATTLDDDLDQDSFLLIDDCNDADPDINPDAVEICGNDVDEDCDDSAPALGAIFPDADGDGYGDMNSGDIDTFVCEDAVPEGFVFGDRLDCDDLDPAIHPDAPVIYYDAVDDNCDGIVEDDQDCDGYLLAVDCDDLDPAIHEDCEVVVEDPPEEPVVEDPVVAFCDVGFSIVSGVFIAPAGSTFVSIYGRRTGSDMSFSDDVSWTDEISDPTDMTVVYLGNTVAFLLDTCVEDADAEWVVNGVYTDADGDSHWICEGGALTTVFQEAWYDLGADDAFDLPVTADVWDPAGFGCDATWSM